MTPPVIQAGSEIMVIRNRGIQACPNECARKRARMAYGRRGPDSSTLWNHHARQSRLGRLQARATGQSGLPTETPGRVSRRSRMIGESGSPIRDGDPAFHRARVRDVRSPNGCRTMRQDAR